MGKPNKGPFSYVSGNIDFYAEIMNSKLSKTKIIIKKEYQNKSDFLSSISQIDFLLQYQFKKFAKRTGSMYKSFSYHAYDNGLHVLQAIKPGNVPGSYAKYVKIFYKDGTIRLIYKDTIDNKGKNIHRHVKWPIEENQK